ncbi:MAG: PH domain-containing protein [Phycisphaerales bacterium]
MIRLTCDNCEKVLEVPESARGQKARCPACGDVRVIPADAPSAGADAAAGAGGAAGSQAGAARAPATGPGAGPEQRVMLVRPAMFRARPFTFLLLAALLFGGLGVAGYFGMVRTAPSQAGVWMGLAAAVLGVVGFGLWWLRKLDLSLEITTKRTIERRGLLSRHTSEVRHRDIRNLQVSQSFFQRLMGVGRLGISSAGQDEIEIVADDLPRPTRIRDAIDRYRTL